MRLVISLVAFFIPGGTQAWADFAVSVSSVKGPVYVKEQTSLEWQRMRANEKIALHSLIQVLEGGSLKLSWTSLPPESQTYRLNLKEPIILRVEPQMMRRVRMSQLLLDQFASDAQDADNNRSLPMQAAWQRFSAVLDNVLEKLAVTFDTNASFSSATENTKSIKVFAPIQDEHIRVPTYPGKLFVAWQAPKEADLKYNIYLWPTGEKNPSKVATTDKTEYHLDVYEPGTYFLKIESTNSAYRSETKLINLVSTVQLTDNALHVDHPEILKLNYPPDGSVIKPTTSDGEVSFSWNSVGKDAEYRLVIYPQSSAGQQQKQTFFAGKETFYTVRLLSGNYTWQILAMVNNGVDLRSTRNMFALRSQRPNFADLMDDVDLSFDFSNDVFVLGK